MPKSGPVQVCQKGKLNIVKYVIIYKKSTALSKIEQMIENNSKANFYLKIQFMADNTPKHSPILTPILTLA
jgi:hypothetical protein